LRTLACIGFAGQTAQGREMVTRGVDHAYAS
jgi:hypothetical protein